MTDIRAERVVEAGHRVAAWARWQRSSGVYLDYPPESTFARLMRPDDVEEQAGARHLAPAATDEAAMAVDRILARLKIQHRRRYRLIRIEFLTGGSSAQKARRVGLNRETYRVHVDLTLGLIADLLRLKF